MDSKPVCYLVVNLILADIQSTIPSLPGLLDEKSYPYHANKLASAYNLVSAFIGFLVRSLDSDSDQESRDQESMPDIPPSPILTSPSLLLTLRTSLAYTLSLTVTCLRDRFDAPSSINLTTSPPSITSHTSSSVEPMARDHLTLAQVRALALWLRDDDNEHLAAEARGIIDVLVALREAEEEFGGPVVMVLEAIGGEDRDGEDEGDEEELNETFLGRLKGMMGEGVEVD